MAPPGTEVTVPASFGSNARDAVMRSDVLFAIGIMGILVVLLIPVPPMLLDLLLCISITLAVVILMTVLFVHRPLELSSFPTILLIATVLRLALNIASTRLILSYGDEGTQAAGYVIQAFSQLVTGGSVLIGAIIFAILTIINFVVITKGSGRIAEVSARFSLDAMPGKQMAIDADLSAGLIDENTARERRKNLEDESSFFGAMDGASKFVRGDAIAGLLIVFINFVGGILIGVMQKDMVFKSAAETYTTLTIGDGLVSQIPALIVSTAAGLLVTKAGDIGSADKAVLGQLGRFPPALGLTCGVLIVMVAVPGIPAIPFLTLAGITGYVAWRMMKRDQADAMPKEGAAKKKQAEEAQAKPAEEPIAETLQIDSIRLELGYGLLPLINYTKGHRLTEQIKALRRQMARELGFVIPPVRIQDNMQLPPNTYVVRVKEIECGRGDIRPDMLLVMDPTGGKIQLPGEETTEPTFGLPAMWVAESYREEALFKNYTVVDPPTVITTHLTECIKDSLSDLLSYADTQKLLDEMGPTHQKLVAEAIPAQVTVATVQRVLQRLLAEHISIRDLPSILEALVEASRSTHNVVQLTEHVRQRLARQLSFAAMTEAGYIPIVTLTPAWEQTFIEGLTGQGDDRGLSMAPSKIQDFVNSMRKSFETFAMKGEAPVLLTSPAIRPYVRSIVERFRPSTIVLSQNEIHPKVKIKTLGQV